MTKHLKHMALGGVVIFGALALFGMPWGTAAKYALLLACPVMMMGMMFFMNHGTGGSSASCHHDHSSDAEGTRGAQGHSSSPHRG